MKEHVTVIPADGLVVVDGVGLHVAFSAPQTLHALQWHTGAGHAEWTDKPNTAVTSYDDEVQPYVALWEAEQARLKAEQAAADAEFNSFPNVRSRAVATVDAATSAAILAGFDYEVEGETLHFSYDSFDQQNFADTGNVATLALSGGQNLPTSVTWNAYRNHTPETGGELVRLTLTAEAFLNLYVGGALAHKAVRMEEGGRRKAAVAACGTVEDIAALLAEWGLA